MSPSRRRECVDHLKTLLGVSERRACRVLGHPRSTQRYKPIPVEDEKALTEAIVELASQFGRYGFRRITALQRHRGGRVNHKRVERIWRREGLRVPAKQRQRVRLWLNDGSCVRLRPAWNDYVWAYDFVHLRLHEGKGVRLLTVIDEYSRECLAIRAARSLRSADVIEVLAELMVFRGVPDHIRLDNGPEFTAGLCVSGWGAGSQDALHRAWVAVGERLHREFQREVEGRTAGQRGLLYVAGGACAGGALPADLQTDQTAALWATGRRRLRPSWLPTLSPCLSD